MVAQSSGARPRFAAIGTDLSPSSSKTWRPQWLRRPVPQRTTRAASAPLGRTDLTGSHVAISSGVRSVGQSADGEKIDDEDQGLAACDDTTSASIAVTHMRRNGETATTTDLHPLHAFVPALNDLALA